MDLYWYWPHPHRRASPLALAALRPGDTLTVQALPSLRGERFEPIEEYRVVRDLPDPTRPLPRPLRPVRRVRTALGRSWARRRLLREGFDVAHVELLTYQTDWLDLRALRAKPVTVATVHDVRPHARRWPVALETAALRALYAPGVADVLVVHHEVLRDELVADFGVAAERVAVLPLPIDLGDDGSPPAAPVDRAPEAARPLFLFFGTLRRNKGVRTLLDAARALPDDPGFDLVVAGAGDDELTREVEDLGRRRAWVQARVGAHVPEAEKAELFGRASVVVLPYESFHSQSAVLTDAYRHGVPLIVTDVGAIGATVATDRTGWVLPAGDAGALAGLMAEVAASDLGAVRTRVAAAACRHDSRLVGAGLREVYERARADVGGSASRRRRRT